MKISRYKYIQPKAMKKICILILCVFSIPYLYSQEVFKEGYVLMNQKDTLFGQIKYQGPERNSEKCCFIPKDGTNEIIYTPKDIYGYRFTGGSFYVSLTYRIDQDEYTRFAEFLLDGIADLYKIYYHNNTHYLVVKNDTTSVFIDTQRAAVQSEANVKEENRRDFLNKGKLKFILQDYPPIYSEVDNLNYQEKSLINIVKDYHNGVCHDYACINYTKRNVRPKMYIGLILGVKSSMFRFVGYEVYYYLTEEPVQWNTSLVYGVSFGMNMPKTNARLSVDFQLSNFTEKFRIDYNGGLDISRIEEIQSEASPFDPEVSTAISFLLVLILITS